MTVMVRPDWNEKAMINIVGLKLKMTNQINEFLVQTVFYGWARVAVESNGNDQNIGIKQTMTNKNDKVLVQTSFNG